MSAGGSPDDFEARLYIAPFWYRVAEIVTFIAVVLVLVFLL